MFYALSDIHGCYKKFEKMLEKIGFSNENDVLYVVGDAVDRGKDGIKVLQLMMKYDHIVPIMGNHDRMAYEILRQFEEKIIIDSDKVKWKHQRLILPVCDYWFQQGGYPTLKGYCKLRKDDREKLLNYIDCFLPCFKTTINSRKFVLVHAGIENFSPEKDIWDYPEDAFLYERMDYDKTYFDDVYIISGHTPTDYIDKNYSGRIFRKNNHIAIDCGAYWRKPLGCICLDSLEEFYVE